MELSTGAIPRLAATASPEAQHQALTMSILTTRWNPDVEASAPLSGQDNLERFEPAVKAHNEGRTRFLIVARALHDETNFHPLDLAGLRHHCGLKRSRGVISTICCTNTADQVRWILQRAALLKVKSLALYTDAYHITRAFGTAVKAMEGWANPIPVVPISVGELDKPVPEMVRKGTFATGYDMVPGEIERFFHYSQPHSDGNGNIIPADVASIEAIRAFMQWMRNEHKHLFY